MSLINSLRKNSPEIQAFLTGNMPSFIYGRKKYRDIPVFCYHEADIEKLEADLKFINENGYRTLTADEYYERAINNNYLNDGKDILLTFDDGLASVWSVGFPLFQRYNVKIVLFVLPGLIEEGEIPGITIENAKNSDDYNYAINRDFSEEPLCNWKELIEMHNSGFVDIQSHSMKHSLVSVSPKIVDFIHPDFDTNTYGNVHIPEYLDDSNIQTRRKVLGHPVYESKPRLHGSNRYKDDYLLRKRCEEIVSSEGGENFFKKDDWRMELQFLCENKGNQTDVYESDHEKYDEMLYEIKQSKREIERRLPNKEVNHFCFPWFSASEKSAKMAYESGYKAIYLGAMPGFKLKNTNNNPYIVKRLEKEYLRNLPGKKHINLIQVFLNKMRKKKSV